MGKWVSRVWLKQGVYRFSGMMRTTQVQVIAQDTRGGAGLRATGAGRLNRARGTRGWAPVSVDFRVDYPVKEVELSCELRAARGSAVFDARTLMLTKLR